MWSIVHHCLVRFPNLRFYHSPGLTAKISRHPSSTTGGKSDGAKSGLEDMVVTPPHRILPVSGGSSSMRTSYYSMIFLLKLRTFDPIAQWCSEFFFHDLLFNKKEKLLLHPIRNELAKFIILTDAKWKLFIITDKYYAKYKNDRYLPILVWFYIINGKYNTVCTISNLCYLFQHIQNHIMN